VLDWAGDPRYFERITVKTEEKTEIKYETAKKRKMMEHGGKVERY
jgi:hypothetical protein